MEDVQQKMEEVLEFLRQDLAGIKTGRATPALVEKIMVEAYETKMPLVELATITVPEPRQLLIAPFDQAIVENIEQALLREKGLGLSPVVDENVIRVKIPPLTEERRRELVKLLGHKLEAARVMIRQVRAEKRSEIRQKFEAKELNEDEKFHQEERLQKLTDEFNKRIEETGKSKELEILSF